MTIKEKIRKDVGGIENVLSASSIAQGKLAIHASREEIAQSFRKYLSKKERNPSRIIDEVIIKVDGTLQEFEQWKADWEGQDSSEF